MWAILSGIEGNLAAYEAVLQDIQRQRYVEDLFILGDAIALNPNSEALVNRLINPRRGELTPQVCQGWWEEQALILHCFGRTGEPTQLIEQYGVEATKQLWDCVPRWVVDWARSLEFGFVELDCLLIHGSSASVEEALTPETSPIVLLDRLARMDVNHLFCGRSGLIFEHWIESGSVQSEIQTLDQRSQHTAQVNAKSIIGVGSVGRIPGKATYALYAPETGRLKFCTVAYGAQKGFAQSKVIRR
jgi:hypothetical protein